MKCIKISKIEDPPLSFIAFFFKDFVHRIHEHLAIYSGSNYWDEFLKDTLVPNLFVDIFQLCFNYFNYVFLRMEILKYLVEFDCELLRTKVSSKIPCKLGTKKNLEKIITWKITSLGLQKPAKLFLVQNIKISFLVLRHFTEFKLFLINKTLIRSDFTFFMYGTEMIFYPSFTW